MITPILTAPFMHVDRLGKDVDLVEEVRALNSEGVQIPWAWSISTGALDPLSHDRQSLTFGIHNEVGALMWTTEAADYVPSSGANPGWLGYFLGGSHETSIPPHAEVPVETVFTALAEFLETRSRPACVQWREAADIDTMFSGSDAE